MLNRLCSSILLLFVTMPGTGEVLFNRDIRPILSDRCFACHGPDAKNKGIVLRLDSEAAAKADLGGRFAVLPGEPEKSGLVARITASSPAKRMPPVHTGLKLTSTEIDLLRNWIAEGARWQKHWSFIPPVTPPLPAVKNTGFIRNPIDAFVLARLEKEGLKPSPEADKGTLIRRASLDLTGLPPTPAEVDAFLLDSSPQAYEKVLDRLLDSPRYGEKMAVRWLDAARYADTNGYQTDAERHMWRWRDWVIEAWNKNMPFNQFVVEQIAGDLLPNPTLDQRIATGFNRNHRGNSEGGIVPEEYLVEYAVDRLETMATTFMGLTVGCARCHNHKYDPITQREFYQLFAYFNNIPEIGRYLKYGNTPPFIKAPTREEQSKLAALERELEAARTNFHAVLPGLEKAQRSWESTLPRSFEWSLADGLAAHDPLDEAESGVVGNAAQFDGKRSIELKAKADYGFYDKFTLSAWIRPDSDDAPIVTKAEETGDGVGYGLFLEKGKLQVNLIKRRLDDSIRVQTKSAIEKGRWQHVAMTYDGSRLASGIHIYLNGKDQELDIILDAINQDFKSAEPLRVGGGALDGIRFKGSIDEARVYGRALPANEIAILAVVKPAGEIGSLPQDGRSAAESAKLRQAFLETAASPEIKAAWQQQRAAILARDKYLETVPTVMVMEERPDPTKTFILSRGSYDKPGEPVTRGVPEVLQPLAPEAPKNRLGLAQWLTSPDNPLTARVAINRFWQSYFGVGLVKTVEDFGSQGEWPSHPELLDWLASDFVRSGWNVKQLQKTILMSGTYRQASKVSPDLDPENRLLARGPRFRLPAETVRDQALYISGLLVEKQGGPSVKPYQPAGLWSELGDKDYEADKGEGLYRRSLYTFWKRTAPPPYMANFDSAMREACAVRESRTNTPLQALNLMNDVTFLEAARFMAQRVLKEAGPDVDARLDFAFRLAVARRPSDKERTMLRRSLDRFSAMYKADSAAAERYLRYGDSPRDSHLDAAEHAAYTAVASLILNLDETITKE